MFPYDVDITSLIIPQCVAYKFLILSLSLLQLVGIKLMFNPKPIHIRLTKKEISELQQYVYRCNIEGFVGINNYQRFNPEREYMYRWHLNDFCFKISKKRFSDLTKLQYVTIAITEIEKRTLYAMFNRVDCGPFMLELQKKLIKKLTRS